ncbi:hypothetical protein Taro_046627, partial [Colocasia esculenta]|nr:hypothetical protein [Colocasia esculenta]
LSEGAGRHRPDKHKRKHLKRIRIRRNDIVLPPRSPSPKLSGLRRPLLLGLRHSPPSSRSRRPSLAPISLSIIFSTPGRWDHVPALSLRAFHSRRACDAEAGRCSSPCSPADTFSTSRPPASGGTLSEPGKDEERRTVDLTSDSRLLSMIGMDGEAVKMVRSVEFWRMAILWTLSLLYSYLLLVLKGACFFLPGHHQLQSYSCSFSRAPTGPKPICVITGATSGLGAAAAKALTAKGFCVVLVGRSPHLLSKIVERITEQVKDAQLKEFIVDMSSIRSIMEFKSSLEQWLSDSNLHPSIQLLINNAGILARSYRVSADGYDQ